MSVVPAYDVDLLIALVKRHDCLWNVKTRAYSDKIIKNRAWVTICSEIFPDFETKSVSEKNLASVELQTKWKNLRDGFMRYCRISKKRSGSEASTSKQYPYYNEMLFLKDVHNDRGSTTSSISLPSETPTPTNTEASLPTSQQTQARKRRATEDQLIDQLSRRLNDKLNENQSEKQEDEDKLFLLSLLSDFKKIPDNYKVYAKSDIIQVIKSYRDPPASNHNYAGCSTGSRQPTLPNYAGYSANYSSPIPPPPPPPPPNTETERPESHLSFDYESETSLITDLFS